jgi:hypothetical protein
MRKKGIHMDSIDYETIMRKPIWTPGDYSAYSGQSKHELARQRMQGDGPPYLKLGDGRQSAIRYRREVVLKWLAERERTSTSAHATCEALPCQ